MPRRQFVLDKKTNRLLEDLAADQGGNRSAVIRAAVQYYADLEASLDAIEQDPAFIAMMDRSEADIRAGRVVPHEQIEQEIREELKRRNREKKRGTRPVERSRAKRASRAAD